MPLLRPLPSAPPPGILATRRAAHPALLRMLSRARRQRTPLLLLAIAPAAEPGGGGMSEGGHRAFLDGLACDLRIGDLAWREPGGIVLALLEGAGGDGGRCPALDRLQRRALAAGARPQWRAARFPEQGLTLQALLEEVAWRP